ncbi:pentatricopeptide repeat-containing protein At3g14580, mitochondrial-like [Olea europaea var. sylvestris]|uniref:pentatricopeptide repeat-containing protein At3g14580, mitochondrial-like n=1 Tax=Olea europaea var. sylvestris TaxID=158386 RepID=UPI000C1D7BAD|nr:pentatricopeptide repeat-containing protein At3g14580, mitochondrial-like [Olea europaea var. sylvestris]
MRKAMIWYSFLVHIPKIHKPIFQISLLSSISLQRLNFSLPSRQFSFSRSFQNPDNLDKNPNIFSRKDWLSPSEVIKIFESLRDPNLTQPLFKQISDRKDYTPNEALYMAVINKLALANDFDGIETLMQRIKLERKCRLSDEFFRNVIKIYGHSAGRINRAIETLFDMPNYKSWPSVKTFNFVLNLLVSTKQFDVVHDVYMGASKLGVEIDACCLNIIIKGLCGCGQMEAAFSVLDEFPKQKCKPNVRTFSIMMHGLCERGLVDEAFNLLERMEMEGVEPDAIVFNILILGLRKRGRVEEGIKLFDRMMLKGCDPNSGTYQEVLYCLLDAKRFVEAKDFMRKMSDRGLISSFESYKLAIHGFCSENLVEDLDWVLRQMVRHGFVPKMGIWKRALHCVFLNSHMINLDHIYYEEIIKN